MKYRNAPLTYTVTLIGLLGLATAQAQEPPKPSKAPKADRFQVDPAVQKKFEEQALRPHIPPELPVVEWEEQTDAVTQHVSARLLSTGDQSVLVAVQLTPEQKRVLGAIWPTVTRIEDADHQMIFGDELCLRYPVALEYDLHRLDPKLGQVLEFEVGSTKDRRPLVLFVRGS